MAESPTSDKAAGPADPERDASGTVNRWLRRTGYRVFRLGGEVVSMVLAGGIIALFFAGGLVSRQSADLTPLRPTFERWFSQSFDGARAELGDLRLDWNPSNDTVSFTASDVVVYDPDGEILQTLDRLSATTRKTDIATRRAVLRNIEIIGGEVTWLERADGTVVAGLGTPKSVGGFGPVFRGTAAAGRANRFDWLEAFETVSMRDSTAHVVRETDGLDIVLDVATFDGLRDGALMQMNMVGDVRAPDGPDAGSVRLEVETEDGLETLAFAIETHDLVPSRIAPSRGRLGALAGVEVPIDVTLEGVNSRSAGVVSATVDVTVGAGRIGLAGREETVESARFTASLDPGEEEMRVERLMIKADHLSLEAQGVVREIGRWSDGDIGTSPKFDLDVSDMRLDLTPVLEAPVLVSRADVVGEIDFDTRTLTLDRLDARFPTFGLELEGRIGTQADGLERVVLRGRSTTALSAPDLLSLWPVDAADGARRWIDRAVLEGRIDNVVFDVDLDADFFETPRLNADRLQLTFDAHDGVVRYISTMDPLVEASGSGRIDGNRFGFVLDSGRIDDVAIVGADVDIPRLTPKGGDILISAGARGRAQSLLGLVNQPPFRYLDRYGVDPDGFAGEADVTLNIRRPLLEHFDEDRIEYDISGTFTDAAAPFSFGPHALHDADVTIKGGKDGLFLTGPANLGPWRADLVWAERFGQNGEPTRYRLTGPVNRETLDGFGIGLREYFGGEIGMDIEASGTGLTIEAATIDLDFAQSELFLPDLWSKPIGMPGSASLDIVWQNDGMAVPRATAVAPGLDLSGSAAFKSGFALREARLDRARIDGFIDGRVLLRRDEAAQRLAVEASGNRLDLTPFVKAALQGAGGETPDLPISLDAAFNQIVLGDDYALAEAALTYRHDGQAVDRFSLKGDRPAGRLVAIMDDAPGSGRSVNVVVPDASAIARSLLGLEAIRDGSLRLQATMPPAGAKGPTIGRLVARDFTVIRAPFLAQILSLASLTGIVDTLSGSGLGFDALEFDFALEDGTLSVRDAKLCGPAIGMTGEGDVDLTGKHVDFGGTLVPAYTANSILGHIPLLGPLLIGRDGEGVFAVTYSVEGPFSGALIAINPLSALTPGFIRGIFRESREDLPDSVMDEIESVRPAPTD
ncbi:AsmA-like C-terminal domain-containing protein [uncultured Algimonas sp.]|uniref:YhdP family protein n=1 Tax=uncultured Algimonas sp. TaxID=1547920 RepID=UPI00260E5EB8|nr:AsmA-like C-terminal domain-containing protein [uncultured Algimonas sp.]